jgi:hypothetical protein
MMNMQGSMMHQSMQTPPPMQQQSHFVVDHRARPEDAAVHITVSAIAMKYNFMFSVTLIRAVDIIIQAQHAKL